METNTDGCLELNIPVAILENCQGLKTGEMVELNGTNKKEGYNDADKFKIFAEKQEQWLSFSFRSQITGSVFQEKLSQHWKCHIVSIDRVPSAPKTSKTSLAKPNPVSKSKADSTSKRPFTRSKSRSKNPGTVPVVRKEPDQANTKQCQETVDKVPAETVEKIPVTDSGNADNDITLEYADVEDGLPKIDEKSSTETKTETDSQQQKTTSIVGEVTSSEPPAKKQKVYTRKRNLQKWKTAKDKDIKDMKCEFCERKWFLSYRVYHRHLNGCHKNPKNSTKQETVEEKELRLKYTCHICQMACGEHRLKRHMRLAHNVIVKKMKPREANTENRCKFCQEVFKSNSSLCRHRRYKCVFNPDARLGKLKRCKYCCSQFDVEDLDRHIKKNHPNGQTYICDVCGKTFQSRIGMYTHKKIHMDETIAKKFECPICRKKWTYKHQYEEHLATHSEEKPVICDLCGKAFKTKKALGKHVAGFHENRYQFYCDKCGHGMAKQKYLDSHKCNRVRRVQVKNEKKPTEEKSTQDAINSDSLDDTKPSQQDVCEEEVVYTTPVSEFTVSITEDGEQIFYDDPYSGDQKVVICVQPEAISDDKLAAQQVISSEVPVRKFACDQCESSFNYKHHLERHKRTVHERRYLYNCQYCGHGAEELRALKSHRCGHKPNNQTTDDSVV